MSLPVYINGKLLPADEAMVSVFDRGFMRGDGLFETLRSYGGRIFRLDDHLARLDHGLDVLHYSVRSADLGLKTAVLDTLKASGVENARVRVQVTRGTGTTEFSTASNSVPTVLVTVHRIANAPVRPLNVIVPSIRRDQMSPLSGIKTINYIPSLLAKTEADQAGADDAILLNYAGKVAEGCTSNVFLVRGDELLTPDLASGVLPGIIRATILEIAPSLGLKVTERAIDLSELESADEVFLTSSVREVAPVVRLNGRSVGNGTSPVAEMLEREYRRIAEP